MIENIENRSSRKENPYFIHQNDNSVLWGCAVTTAVAVTVKFLNYSQDHNTFVIEEIQINEL